ncbi:hypothetical protein SUS17_3733 [Sphingomonas sp. S17]|nr:hypothetical protein SUS17_3733 [Sphingomonas sp. S17]
MAFLLPANACSADCDVVCSRLPGCRAFRLRHVRQSEVKQERTC